MSTCDSLLDAINEAFALWRMVRGNGVAGQASAPTDQRPEKPWILRIPDNIQGRQTSVDAEINSRMNKKTEFRSFGGGNMISCSRHKSPAHKGNGLMMIFGRS
jgi:hypothetical protein